MASTLKLINHTSVKSVFNKLHLQSYRTISTFHRSHCFPLISIHSNQYINSLYFQNLSNPTLLPTTSYRFISQTNDENENDVDKKQEDTDNDTNGTQSEDVEDVESEEEESDNQQITDLRNQIINLETEVNKYKNGLARSQADLINLQNMSKKDVTNARNFAIKSFSKDMLQVADSLQNCIKIIEEHIDEYISKTNDDNINKHVKAIIDGIKLTENTLLNTFNRHDIKKVACYKHEFDPNIHEALFKMASSDVPADHIVQVIAEGYSLKENVLRAAKVGVSTGPPPTSPPVADQTDVDDQSQDQSNDDDNATDNQTDDNANKKD